MEDDPMRAHEPSPSPARRSAREVALRGAMAVAGAATTWWLVGGILELFQCESPWPPAWCAGSGVAAIAPITGAVVFALIVLVHRSRPWVIALASLVTAALAAALTVALAVDDAASGPCDGGLCGLGVLLGLAVAPFAAALAYWCTWTALTEATGLRAADAGARRPPST